MIHHPGKDMPTQNATPSTMKAWDPLIRVFHWGLVIAFVIAFITEGDWINVHIWAGYAVTALIVFRLFWGLVGSRNARFTSFVRSRRVVMEHLKAMLAFRPAHYLGHNPVAAVMVMLLLFSIVMAAFSGIVLIAIDGQGPLANTLFSSWNGDWMKDFHELLANFSLLLVFGHIAGVLISSFLEGENLVKAMVTGRKKMRPHWEDVDSTQEAGHNL
jgi:cytochrome b